MTVPKHGSVIEKKDCLNSYIRVAKNSPEYKDISHTLKPKKDSLMEQILEMSKEYDLEIISQYRERSINPKKTLEQGKTVYRKKPAYAFMNRSTGEIWFNIVMDVSRYATLALCYNAVTDFNYLGSAKYYASDILKEDLYSFSGSVQKDRETNPLNINSITLDATALIEYAESAGVKQIRLDNIIKILIPIMYGPDSKVLPASLRCLVSGRLLSKIAPEGEIVSPIDLHHIKVVNGASEHKTKVDGTSVEPSVLLMKKSLIDDKKAIKDLMGTLILDQGTHDQQHRGYGKNQGIEVYDKSHLSYVLKSKENYDEIIALFDIENDCGYEAFVDSQKNPLTEKKHYNFGKLVRFIGDIPKDMYNEIPIIKSAESTQAIAIASYCKKSKDETGKGRNLWVVGASTKPRKHPSKTSKDTLAFSFIRKRYCKKNKRHIYDLIENVTYNASPADKYTPFSYIDNLKDNFGGKCINNVLQKTGELPATVEFFPHGDSIRINGELFSNGIDPVEAARKSKKRTKTKPLPKETPPSDEYLAEF